MQNQENTYYTPELSPSEQRTTNVDPREQPRQQEESYRPYTEGYGGAEPRDIWSEGEKLQAKMPKSQRSMGGLFALLVLLCAVFIAGSLFGAILSWLSWLIVIVLIIAGLAAFATNWRVVTIPLPERRFQITEHARLTINNGAGKVAIRRGEPGAITVAATKRASGFGINPEKMQINYDQRGDALNISTEVAWNIFQFGMRSVQFEITVPENCDVQLSTGAGGVAVQGTSGNIYLRTGSGGIEIQELQGQIELKTGSGGIRASNIQGHLRARTGSGGIKAQELQGQAELKTGSGGIEGYGLRGQISLSTGSGGLVIHQGRLAGSSRFTTGSGGIVFEGELDPRGETLMKTGAGGIKLSLPANSAFSLDAKTGSGGVSNAFGSKEVGSGPRARLQLRTGSGGIHIANSDLF